MIASIALAMFIDNYKVTLHGLNKNECNKIGIVSTEQTYGGQNCMSTYQWINPKYHEIPGPLGIGKQIILIEKGYCFIGTVCQGVRR